MCGIDFTYWESVFATLLGLALVTLIGVGLRLLLMVTVQHRRERMNRQINERLRILIAAYKVLGGSFTERSEWIRRISATGWDAARLSRARPRLSA